MIDDNKPLWRFYKGEASPKNVQGKTKSYLNMFKKSDEAIIKARLASYMDLVNSYYDLVTDFYEYGWGESYHFACPKGGESYEEAMNRVEYYFGYRLGLQKGQKALDVGCGSGGPMRSVARFTGAQIIGINNNRYQIKKGEKYNRERGLASQCSFVEADFTKTYPFEDHFFDGAFSSEAICHAPSRVAVYQEVFRVLKPGTYFTGTEWCMTPKYDPNNPVHFRLKEGIAKGAGIAELFPSSSIAESLRAVGFEVIECRDFADESPLETPWYGPLAPRLSSIKGFRRSLVGRFLTIQLVKMLELVRMIPKGSTAVNRLLSDCGVDLLKAGQLGIFTPEFYFLARKPEHR